MGTREQDKFSQTFPRTHMHQDVTEAKKKKKIGSTQKPCGLRLGWTGKLGRVEKRVGVVGGRL